MGKIKGWKKQIVLLNQIGGWKNINSGIKVVVSPAQYMESGKFYSIHKVKLSGNTVPIARANRNKKDAIKNAMRYMHSHPNG